MKKQFRCILKSIYKFSIEKYNFSSFKEKLVSHCFCFHYKHFFVKIKISKLKNNYCYVYKYYDLTKHRRYDSSHIPDSTNLARHVKNVRHTGYNSKIHTCKNINKQMHMYTVN